VLVHDPGGVLVAVVEALYKLVNLPLVVGHGSVGVVEVEGVGKVVLSAHGL
jgi:hypothetical protein